MNSFIDIKTRLDPTPQQAEKLAMFCGARRFAYNSMLAYAKECYESGIDYKPSNFYAVRKTWNTRKAEVAPWWTSVSKEAFASGCKDLATAYKRFFDHQAFYPKFAHKGENERFGVSTGFKIPDAYGVYIPRIGRVHILENIYKRVKRIRAEKIIGYTVSQRAGKWFVSFHCQVENRQKLKTNQKAGIDLGLKAIATTSDGEVLENPRFSYKSERKIVKLNRKLARQQKGSARRAKTKLALQKAHLDVANQRADYIHKATSYLINRYDFIAIEDLNIQDMGQTRLAKSVYDASMGEFARQLEYKSEMYGRELHKIGRFEPSTQICSTCGDKTGPKGFKQLGVREWVCPSCGTLHDRDINAAVNILNFAVSPTENGNGRGGDVRPETDLRSKAAPVKRQSRVLEGSSRKAGMQNVVV